jgi:TonB-dependent starch-binding outer membrane protein SusC
MHFKKAYLISLICLLISIDLSAQITYSIKGIVQDESNSDTLIGVTILLKGTKKGTVTNAKGGYVLNLLPGDDTLVFSYTGYETKEVQVSLKGSLFINVNLNPALTSIEEVKITGQRRFFGNMEYGREIPSINAKVIEKQNANNASDILHASVAGVWATNTSGSPGDHEKIRIRGQSSFFSSAEPLYVVDGVPVPIVNMSSLGIADLNIHDIDNITILKDASSTALYGFQGGNGVVLIDTKKGGENEINFSTKCGIQWFDNFYDLMDTKDFLASLQLAKNNIISGLYNFYPKITDNPSDDNWQKEIFRTGLSNEYQLSGSGTARKIKYYLSGNYTNQEGILQNASYRRYTFSSRFSRVFWKKLVIDAGYRGSLQENKDNQDIYLGNPLLIQGINKSPCLRNTPDSLIYDKHGLLLNRVYYAYNGLNNPELPQSIILNNSHSLRISSHVVSGSARLQLTDHLSLNAMESLMLRYSNYDYNAYSVIVKSNEDVFLFNHQYNISYFNTFGKHKIDLVAAYRFYEDNLWWKVDTMQGQLNSYSYLRNSMAAYGPNGSVLRSIGSYVANASYNYNETYFISAVANLSNIKEGLHINYYSLFPSLALSWDIAREWPFKKLAWLNNFSLYTNWGKSGNYPLNGLANDLYQDVQYTYGTYTGTYPAVLQLANHYLRHESTEELDYGIKSSFFDKRISITATYYIKNINNLIVQRQIPDYYGGGMQYINVGAIGVNGTELGIEANPVRTRNFSWNLKFNFSTSRQVVKKVLDDKPMIFGNNGDVLIPEFIIKEGQPLGDIYGYLNMGKWTAVDAHAKDIRYQMVGGMKYLNADTTNKNFNVDDMVVIGNSIPKYTWNFSNTFQYKNFSLDILWYAVQGVKKYNATRAATIMAGTNREINNYLLDSINPMRTSQFYQSSVFIDDASFIRLKTVTISYESSKKLFGHVRYRFSLSFENMITFTNYKGYDPEATTFTDNNFSDNAIDRGSVPNPKAVYGTIGLTF